jgi:putative hydrolase of the HAD superfamily
MSLADPRQLRAVTFDCWGTLIQLRDEAAVLEMRVEAICAVARDAGSDPAEQEARRAFAAAWQRHNQLWTEGVASGAPEMAGWTLEALGIGDPALAGKLAHALEQSTSDGECAMLEGARDTLERLAERGVRRALICDTGISPGSVVRRTLDRLGLLELLEVQVFSNEAGVPKPNPRVFHAALEPLGVASADAVHVGDLRRTDVAGARGIGMGSIRIRQVHDDRSDHPEADAVADSHRHLLEILTPD